MLPLVFSSSLGSDQRDELESLMFFHPEQGQHISSINASIISYGFPKGDRGERRAPNWH